MGYKIPRADDIPTIASAMIEIPEQEGPFGAKGVGEPGSVPTAPAIANAVFDAVGVRIRDLPITPEKIIRELEEADHIQ
jgi:xanthine dehydrogenase molybdenum-binding subunit